MIGFSEYFLTWLVGVLSGLLVSIPVGPINITILNEGARKGFRWALFIGFGSVAMELIYCAIGFAGFSTLFNPSLQLAMEIGSFLLMLFLGLKYLFLHSIPATTKTIERVENRLHPHSAFFLGFVRVLANPNVLLGWIMLSATFISHRWMGPNWGSKLICISGVGVGALAWFVFLSYVVSRGQGRFSANTLLRMSQVSGAILLGMAVVIAILIVRRLYYAPEMPLRA